MADNLVEKILKDHVESGTYEQGEEVGLRIDQCLLQDATGTMACLQLEQMGVDRVQVPLAVQYVDHNIIQLDHKNPDDHIFLQAFVFFFFNDTATTEIYTLSLHDALPI